MNLSTLIHYLTGDADAIRVVATSPDSLVIGGMLVLSAALARTWQRHDLVKNPRILALPFVASIASSGAFVLMFAVWSGQFRKVLSVWPDILGLFWMTAPLAWLYGFPFERYGNRVLTVKRRLWTLLLVSVWRMTLMMRVLSVLFDLPGLSSFVFVLTFGDVVALAAIHGTMPREPKSVPTVMLGMGSLSPVGPPETQTVQTVTGCLLPELWLGLLILLPLSFQMETGFGQYSAVDPALPATAGMWGLAAGAVAFWCLLLPGAQRKQRKRTHAESLIESGQFEQSAEFLHSCRQNDLPDQWTPPVQRAFLGEDHERLLGTVAAVAKLPPDSWVRSAVFPLFLQYVQDPILYWFDDDRSTQVGSLLEQTGAGSSDEAAETLQQLDSMKQMIGVWSDRIPSSDQHEDAISKVDSPEDPNLISEWPELNEARQRLLQRLKTTAGDRYREPEENSEHAD